MNLIESIGGYKLLWQSVIRPSRQNYFKQSLGPTSFLIKGQGITRADFQLKNPRGYTLECSMFLPDSIANQKRPVVIYLHGNCSSRLEALHLVWPLLAKEICVCCFDFSGCGMSEGDYISLGYHEQQDLQTVIDYLKAWKYISKIGVWGRSMGAVTWLLSPTLTDQVSCLVLDSPFQSLKVICTIHAKNQFRLPKSITKHLLKLLRKTIQDKANFDIFEINPIKQAKNFTIPAYFLVAQNDLLVPASHQQKIYHAYGGIKNFMCVEGDHNTFRSEQCFHKVTCWLAEYLITPEELIERNPGLPFRRSYTGLTRSHSRRREESQRLQHKGDTDTVKETEQSRLRSAGDYIQNPTNDSVESEDEELLID